MAENEAFIPTAVVDEHLRTLYTAETLLQRSNTTIFIVQNCRCYMAIDLCTIFLGRQWHLFSNVRLGIGIRYKRIAPSDFYVRKEAEVE